MKLVGPTSGRITSRSPTQRQLTRPVFNTPSVVRAADRCWQCRKHADGQIGLARVTDPYDLGTIGGHRCDRSFGLLLEQLGRVGRWIDLGKPLDSTAVD